MPNAKNCNPTHQPLSRLGMGTKVVKINGVCRRTPLIGKNVFMDFPNMESDPFKEDKFLMTTICGALRIRTSSCFTSYDPETKTASIMFHFTRPEWALKIRARMEAIQKLIGTSILREEDTVPATPEDLDLDVDSFHDSVA
jgi:hypothetical protein